MVTIDLEEDELSFLHACLEEISNLVTSTPPELLFQLLSKLSMAKFLHHQSLMLSQDYDFSDQVSSDSLNSLFV
jgi:hypothetical protein